jgi:hypothetical protein
MRVTKNFWRERDIRLTAQMTQMFRDGPRISTEAVENFWITPA